MGISSRSDADMVMRGDCWIGGLCVEKKELAVKKGVYLLKKRNWLLSKE